MDFVSALRQAESWVGRVPGVVGVAEGVHDGRHCITVFVSSGEPHKLLPHVLGEWCVVLQGVGTTSTL